MTQTLCSALRFQAALADLRIPIHSRGRYVIPAVITADGTRLSIQASEVHCCSPRANGRRVYEAFEVVAYDSQHAHVLDPFLDCDDTHTPATHTPATVVETLIDLHGGIDMDATFDPSNLAGF